ncbi:protein phosphatase 2C domain-containing protein [Streptosporangiaceae bacterium NEAU-GS5]|nr:protein phosphatase 2C domain-containing protein [Streptosporangiaceae bacterium NEAU-GS5]
MTDSEVAETADATDESSATASPDLEAEAPADVATDSEIQTGTSFPAPLHYGAPHPNMGELRGLPNVFQAVPDIIVDGADLTGLTVRAASLRGDDHRWYGETRQDSMGLSVVGDSAGIQLLLACVADGIGSEPLSHLGSALACRYLKVEIEASLDEILGHRNSPQITLIIQRVIARVGKRMAHHAEERGMDPKRLSTTLTAALVDMAPADGARYTLLFGVGDSSALVLTGGRFDPVWAGEAAGDTISDSGTAALPGQAGAARVIVRELAANDVLVICTDGLINPMKNQDVSAQLATSWAGEPIPGLVEFAWQLGFRAKSYGDDRTAVCVWGR